MGDKSKGTGDEKSERPHSTDEAGEPTQGTRGREGGRHVREPAEGKKAGQQSPTNFLTGLDWVAKLASRRPRIAFNTLAHHIDVAHLERAFRLTRKDGAPGVDGATWEHYAHDLEDNLKDLHERFHSGRYKAPPVKRVWIPKGDGSRRPIGIPTLEDKVLQRAVVMLLEAVYEQDFLFCSYGFRPHRSTHTALDALWNEAMSRGGGTLVEVDIKGFFDNLDHQHLRAFLELRVRDGVIRRQIDKWLKAGVLEKGALKRSKKGTPQGGVISPLLANIYLHYVLDTWFNDDIRPKLSGWSYLVRYADDFVMLFEKEDDAQRVMHVLPKRFGKYGLTLHPDKTRMVPFKKPSDDDDDEPGTFTFLGFTHYWGTSRNGNPVIRKKTAKKSMNRSLQRLGAWLMRVRHQALKQQFLGLSRRLRGHYAYFGVTGNADMLSLYRKHAIALWRRALARREQSGRLSWSRFLAAIRRFVLPWPKVVRSVYRRSETLA